MFGCSLFLPVCLFIWLFVCLSHTLLCLSDAGKDTGFVRVLVPLPLAALIVPTCETIAGEKIVEGFLKF